MVGTAIVQIEEAQQDLENWVHEVLGKVPIVLTIAEKQDSKPQVGLHLVSVIHTPTAHGKRHPPIYFTLQYLITVSAKQARQAQQHLLLLMLAAVEHPRFEVQEKPIPAQMWIALGVSLRASFVINVPLKIVRPEQIAPLVRSPIVKTSLMTSLTGSVLGPEDIPIPGAQVVIKGLNRSTRTDRHGQFHFNAVPMDPPTRVLDVRARGNTVTYKADTSGVGRDPLTIRFDRIEV